MKIQKFLGRIIRQTPPNMWGGTTVGVRKSIARIDHLRKTDFRVKFLSVEPLLEDLGELDLTGISWLIAGAESGPGMRPMNLDWVRSIRDQCQTQGVSFFFKQMIERGKKVELPFLDGRQWREFPA